MRKIRPFDIVIFLFSVFCGVFFILQAKNVLSNRVKIIANEKIYEFDLNKDGIFDIEGKIGITKIEIKDKKVRVLESVCPNKNCVLQGFSDYIVCLPNKVVVKIQNKNEEFDAISR